MFSYSVINTAAPGSLNPTHHNQHRHLQVSSYSDVVSDHHHRTNLVPRMAAQDAQLYDDHVPIESIITFISSSGNTTMDKHLPGSAARVTTRKKCDKRSKIRTSQGLRDRRVRLSIETARKFFDLQDLLGFDKPSRTVEWLLTKSNKAILELTGASASSTTSSSEQAEGTEDYCFKSLCSSRSTATCSTNQVQHVSSDDSLKTMKLKEALLTSRESRERARARARARTFAKLCTSKLHHHQEIRLAEYCQNFSSPSSLWKSTSHAERQEELKRKEEEQRSPKQKQHLQLRHSYFPNPNLSEDHWDHISSVIPLPSSSATNILNLSTTDVEMYTRSSWDQLLLHHYRTL